MENISQENLYKEINKNGKKVNYYSHEAERAKKRNLPMIEQDYFSRILGIDEAMRYFGYTLQEDGRRADCGESIEPIEYMHYKEIER